MVLGRALLVLMVALLFFRGSGPALAMHESGACGTTAPEDPFNHEQFIDIGSRFLVRNVRVAQHPEGVMVAGEMYNGLQGFFSPPLFKATIFDSECTYLRANNFSIDKFTFGTTRSFWVVVPGVERSEVATYHIEYLGWPSK